MIGLKKNWLGPNFVIAILRAYTMYDRTSTFSDGWGQLKGSGPVHIMHTVRINIRQIYILMNISESNLSLKLQQYITFTSAHQQIFIEISIILIFFLSVQYIYWSA